MSKLTGLVNFRSLALLAALALLFTTACWAAAVRAPLDEDGKVRTKGDSASGDWSSIRGGKSGYGVDRTGPYDGAQGIHVRATGTASGTPDLAILSLGVEAVANPASEAREHAAGAMAEVMQVLLSAGIEERDIQTQHFSISPRYQSVRVTECGNGDGDDAVLSGPVDEENCITRWEQELTGYSVSNQLAVNIRELEQAGTVIDLVTKAAGDLVRINGISFTIEDIEPLREQARIEAMAKVKAKAESLAGLAGVGLGRLVHLQEQTGYIEPFQPVYARAQFFEESGADTSISPGELDVSVSVSAVYLIHKVDAE